MLEKPISLYSDTFTALVVWGSVRRQMRSQIAYLLQKMEEYEGITILTTNLRQNLDEAFIRRVRFIIEFPFPEADSRLQIWQGIWPKETPLAADVDLNI